MRNIVNGEWTHLNCCLLSLLLAKCSSRFDRVFSTSVKKYKKKDRSWKEVTLLHNTHMIQDRTCIENCWTTSRTQHTVHSFCIVSHYSYQTIVSHFLSLTLYNSTPSPSLFFSLFYSCYALDFFRPTNTTGPKSARTLFGGTLLPLLWNNLISPTCILYTHTLLEKVYTLEFEVCKWCLFSETRATIMFQ